MSTAEQPAQIFRGDLPPRNAPDYSLACIYCPALAGINPQKREVVASSVTCISPAAQYTVCAHLRDETGADVDVASWPPDGMYTPYAGLNHEVTVAMVDHDMADCDGPEDGLCMAGLYRYGPRSSARRAGEIAAAAPPLYETLDVL